MPMKNWAALRFRTLGGDDPDAAAETQFNEVTDLDGLPVRVMSQPLPVSWLYRVPTGTTTTTLKAGSGVLHSLTINTTAAAAVTVYDSLSGSGTLIATFPASAVVGTYTYDIEFTTGLTFVLAGASDITVAFR